MRKLSLTMVGLIYVTALTACADETVSGFADRNAVYKLKELDGVPFGAQATITFPEKGRIVGDAPCNKYSGSQSAPYPWFEPGALAVTRRACPDLKLEHAFLAALSQMRVAEISGTVLILTDEAAERRMLFQSDKNARPAD